MKHLSLAIYLFFQISCLYSQKRFIISGTTNLLTSGKVILLNEAPKEFYSIKINIDTVIVNNSHFVLEGSILNPQQFRLLFLDNNDNYITEPFFIDSGFQKITIDSGGMVNKFLDIGYGVLIEGSETNDEYIKNYLPLFDSLNKRIVIFLNEVERCDTIKDIEIKKKCIIKTELERVNLRISRDSILLFYSIQNPKSPIIPWLLYKSIEKYRYNAYYQKVYDQIELFILPNIKISLNTFLNQQKGLLIGSIFPLNDYINAKISKNYLQNNKYTLVEFWFSGCHPCIAQFNLLRKVYKKFSKKKFDIVAISIDGTETITKYRKTLKSLNYPWKQILDLGGIRTSSINIQKYPTSFLLDKNGKIVNIDINPVVLDKFLEKNL